MCFAHHRRHLRCTAAAATILNVVNMCLPNYTASRQLSQRSLQIIELTSRRTDVFVAAATVATTSTTSVVVPLIASGDGGGGGS